MGDSSANQIAVFVLVYQCTLQTAVHRGSFETCFNGGCNVLFVCFQGHPVLQQVDKCVIHISWATSAACPEAQLAELDKCRVFDNSTREYYSLKPLYNVTHGLSYHQVV